MIKELNISKEAVLKILKTVTDPELPVLSVIDLGIVRNVEISSSNKIKITVTPTYSGCPATDVINMNIRLALTEHGFTNVEIINVLFPVWTTDWMSEEAKHKLKAYGIAAPDSTKKARATALFTDDETILCPQCKSTNTALISRFGSTACKALYKCNNCLEPFDYFKCH